MCQIKLKSATIFNILITAIYIFFQIRHGNCASEGYITTHNDVVDRIEKLISNFNELTDRTQINENDEMLENLEKAKFFIKNSPKIAENESFLWKMRSVEEKMKILNENEKQPDLESILFLKKEFSVIESVSGADFIIHSYSKPDNSEENKPQPDDCAICLEKLNIYTCKLGCGHILHKACFIGWAINGDNPSDTCPMCRNLFYKYKSNSALHSTG